MELKYFELANNPKSLSTCVNLRTAVWVGGIGVQKVMRHFGDLQKFAIDLAEESYSAAASRLSHEEEQCTSKEQEGSSCNAKPY